MPPRDSRRRSSRGALKAALADPSRAFNAADRAAHCGDRQRRPGGCWRHGPRSGCLATSRAPSAPPASTSPCFRAIDVHVAADLVAAWHEQPADEVAARIAGDPRRTLAAAPRSRPRRRRRARRGDRSRPAVADTASRRRAAAVRAHRRRPAGAGVRRRCARRRRSLGGQPRRCRHPLAQPRRRHVPVGRRGDHAAGRARSRARRGAAPLLRVAPARGAARRACPGPWPAADAARTGRRARPAAAGRIRGRSLRGLGSAVDPAGAPPRSR